MGIYRLYIYIYVIYIYIFNIIPHIGVGFFVVGHGAFRRFPGRRVASQEIWNSFESLNFAGDGRPGVGDVTLGVWFSRNDALLTQPMG